MKSHTLLPWLQQWWQPWICVSLILSFFRWKFMFPLEKTHWGVTLLKFFWPCLSLVCCLVIWFCLRDDSCSVGFCFMARYDSRIMLNLFLQSCFPTVEMEQCRMHFQTVRACCSIISLKWGWRGFPDWWKNRLFLASNKLYLDTRWESAKLNLSKKVAQGGCVPGIP